MRRVLAALWHVYWAEVVGQFRCVRNWLSRTHDANVVEKYDTEGNLVGFFVTPSGTDSVPAQPDDDVFSSWFEMGATDQGWEIAPPAVPSTEEHPW